MCHKKIRVIIKGNISFPLQGVSCELHSLCFLFFEMYKMSERIGVCLNFHVDLVKNLNVDFFNNFLSLL